MTPALEADGCGGESSACATYVEGVFGLLTFSAANSDDDESVREGGRSQIERDADEAASSVQDPVALQSRPSDNGSDDGSAGPSSSIIQPRPPSPSGDGGDETKDTRRACHCQKRIFILGACLFGVALGTGLAVSYVIGPTQSSADLEEAVDPSYEGDTFGDSPGVHASELPSAQPTTTVPNVANGTAVGDGPPRPAFLTATSSNETFVTFHVMADTPYSDHERHHIMPNQIANLDTDASFLVHLGDLQNAQVDECREDAYRVAREILDKSALPVFPLPGDNDINDCEELEHGHLMWQRHFSRMDEQWEHKFEVLRWGQVDESFAFLHNGILFLGLNIIGGSPHDRREWWVRHATHLQKVKSILTAHSDDFTAVVLFAHASPGTYHNDFFLGEDGLAQFVEQMGKPFLHLHGDDHYWYETEKAFDVKNYMMISLDQGEEAPPIKVTIDTSEANLIEIDRVESDFEVRCCNDWWWQSESTHDDDRYDDD